MRKGPLKRPSGAKQSAGDRGDGVGAAASSRRLVERLAQVVGGEQVIGVITGGCRGRLMADHAAIKAAITQPLYSILCGWADSAWAQALSSHGSPVWR